MADAIALFGALLLVVGFIAVMLALAKRTGKQKAFNVGLAGLAVFAVGYFMGGIPALIGLAVAPTAPPTPPAQALWDIRLTRGVYDNADPAVANEAGLTSTVSTDGMRVDVYGAEADLVIASAQMGIDVTVINLNQGDSSVTWQLVATYGTIGRIEDSAAGTSAPLVSPDATDPSIADMVWTDDGAPDGAQVSNKYYVSIDTSASLVLTVEADVNDAAMTGNLVTGQTYEFDLVVAGVTLQVLIHPTA